MPHGTTIRTNGQTLKVNSSVSYWTSEALALTASGTNDVESTTTTTIAADYTLWFANTATTAVVTVTQLDGTTLFTGTLQVNPGVGARTLNPVPDTFGGSADAGRVSLHSTRYLSTGECVLGRDNNLATQAGAVASGVLHLTYFRSLKTESVANLGMIVGSVAAAATPTLCRMGLYEEDPATGDLTLVAAHASDTTLFASINTKYTKAVTTPYTRTAGKRYAFGVIVTSGATMPDFIGVTYGAAATMNTELETAPRVTARLTGQTDLPATITNANVGSTTTRLALQGIVT